MRRGGQVLLLGNGAIIRSCNGTDFNNNFHLAVWLPYTFIFVRSQMGIVLPLLLIKIIFSATKMNVEKLPAEGGVHV